MPEGENILLGVAFIIRPEVANNPTNHVLNLEWHFFSSFHTATCKERIYIHYYFIRLCGVIIIKWKTSKGKKLKIRESN